jgi:hypothetical protein
MSFMRQIDNSNCSVTNYSPYSYTNPNGSKFSRHADGSKHYDPGPNKIGRKWHETAGGVRTYDDTPQQPQYSATHTAQYPEYTDERIQAEVMYEEDYDSEDWDSMRDPPVYSFEDPGMSFSMGLIQRLLGRSRLPDAVVRRLVLQVVPHRLQNQWESKLNHAIRKRRHLKRQLKHQRNHP